MIIKRKNQPQSYLDIFDIADSSKKETNLSKFFAYIISINPYALTKIIDLIDGYDDIFKGRKSKLVLKDAEISIENTYSKEDLIFNNETGRTDIEIKIYDKADKTEVDTIIIIECKVHNNKATYQQFQKYKNVFNTKDFINAKHKYFVYLSNQSGINLLVNNELKQVDLNWREVINDLYDIQHKEHSSQNELRSFINYYERR